MRLFASLLLLAGALTAHAQAVFVDTVPQSAPTNTALRAPNGSASHAFLRAHFVVPASEMAGIPAGTTFLSFGFSYVNGTSQQTGGHFRVYLENTSDTTNLKTATWGQAIGPMALIYDGHFDLPVGDAPVTVDLPIMAGSNFVYTGGGLYVAYEYVGEAFAASGNPANYAANADLAGALEDASEHIRVA